MSGMDHGGSDAGGGAACKISVSHGLLADPALVSCSSSLIITAFHLHPQQMLWNWNTVDSCFISSDWHVRSKGGFAGSCIGVVALVILLEGLKYLQRKHDRSIVVANAKRARRMKKQKMMEDQEYSDDFEQRGAEILREKDYGINETVQDPSSSAASSSCCNPPPAPTPIPAPLVPALISTFIQSPSDPPTRLRLTVPQQALRALIHTAQFAVAYFVMLLAMYFNGYIIICIFLGAYIGSFIFSWDVLEGGG